MDEPFWRLILVGAVSLAAPVVAWAARRRQATRWSRMEIDATGIEGRVLLFTERTCRSCDRVRAMLQGSGAEFTEIRYEEDPDVHHSAGVTAVPLLLVRAADGSVAGIAAGIPSRRSLRLLLDE